MTNFIGKNLGKDQKEKHFLWELRQNIKAEKQEDSKKIFDT